MDFILTKKSFTKEYKAMGNIGQPGQFGFAQKCCDRNGNNFAVKVVDKNKFNILKQRKVFYQQLKSEVEIMKNLEHPNVIKYYDICEDEENLYIVMELCEGGELFDRITEKGHYSEQDAAIVLRKIMSGLLYLHSNKIAHLDLKPDNFLFLDKNEDSELKIIDFGMSTKMQRHQYLNRLVGTPYYVAPEVLRGHYTESCDVWSVGIIMFILLFGYPPFYSDPNDRNSDKKIFDEIKKGFQPVTKDNYGPWFPTNISCSESAKDLIAKMLDYNPIHRITVAEALDHPWLSGETANSNDMDKSVIKRLLSFKKSCRLKQGFLNLMVNELTDSEVKKLKEEFEKIDLNKNGRISKKELQVALEKIDDEEVKNVEKIMKQLDIDCDGHVSYSEWCMIAINKRLMNKEERLLSLFNKIDTNNDGKLSPEELRKAMSSFDPEFDIETAIKEADIDGDGNIDYNEFLAVFEKLE